MANEIDSIEGEVWKPVLGWEGLYEVSSHGRVRRLKGTSASGRFSRIDHHRVLRPRAKGKIGYLGVTLRHGRKRTKSALVHVLVCEAFHGPRPAHRRYHAAHWDGDHTNNREDNLRWATPKENGEDRVRLGRSSKGERNIKAKLSADNVIEIRAMRATGRSMKSMAEEYGVHRNTIWWIIAGKTWTHIK
jgi:hypothetical protein